MILGLNCALRSSFFVGRFDLTKPETQDLRRKTSDIEMEALKVTGLTFLSESFQKWYRSQVLIEGFDGRC